MQTKQLHYIIEIARQQSLSGAAKVLGISQPALSQFIAAEEKSLGVSLFFSYRNRLYPTPAGTICIKAAAEMIRIKEQTYRKIRSCRADSRKRVRIGVSDFAAERMAAKAVPAVFGRYPDASVVPVVGTDSWLADQLRQGNLDMAVLGTGSPQVSGGSFYQFAKREVHILIPREFKMSDPLRESRQGYSIISLEELKNFPFIAPETGTPEREIAEELFSEAGFRPNVIYVAADPYAALELAETGFGVSMLPEPLADQADREKVRIFSLPQHPSVFYGVLLGEEKRLDDVEELLICCILRGAAREEGGSLLYNEASRKLMEQYAGEEELWTQNRLNI